MKILVATLCLLASPAFALNLCTGLSGGNYDYSGQMIAANSEGVIDVALQSSPGSMTNLERLDAGLCDAAIVQSDAYAVYRRQNPQSQLTLITIGPLYQEFIHLICNGTLGIGGITDLKAAHTVLTGPSGGGTAVTWEAFRIANSRYRDVDSRPIGGKDAAVLVKSHAIIPPIPPQTQSRRADCLMFVTGLKAGQINEANKLGLEAPGSLVLVTADDDKILDMRDHGRPLYKTSDIPAKTYPGIQPSAWFFQSWAGMDGTSTIAVTALLVARQQFVDDNNAAHLALVQSLKAAMPKIEERVKPKS